jgi:putative ABC transport system permease protein
MRAPLGVLPSGLPPSEDIRLDARVLIVTTAISLLAGILFGLVPAVKGSELEPHEAPQKGGAERAVYDIETQGLLIAAETAMALVLLLGAGLMFRTLGRIWSVDPGFDPRNVLTFSHAFPPASPWASSPRSASRACSPSIRCCSASAPPIPRPSALRCE